MFYKYLAFALIFSIVNLAFGSAVFAQTQNDAKSLEKIKAKIAKIGTKPNAEAVVKLKDGTKLKGNLADIKDDGFTVIDKKTKVSTAVQYAQVSKVNAVGKLPRAAVIAIGVGVAAGALLLAYILALPNT